MTNQTRHFLLTPEGAVREFSAEQAAHVAAGANKLPEFAGHRIRYLQVTVNDDNNNSLKVQSAGACIRFDADGRLAEATPPGENEAITSFEHDACIQWALKGMPAASPTFH